MERLRRTRVADSFIVSMESLAWPRQTAGVELGWVCGCITCEKPMIGMAATIPKMMTGPPAAPRTLIKSPSCGTTSMYCKGTRDCFTGFMGGGTVKKRAERRGQRESSQSSQCSGAGRNAGVRAAP